MAKPIHSWVQRQVLGLCLASLALVAGCAGPQQAQAPAAPPLADALFAPPQEPVDVAALFTLSPEMQAFLRWHLGTETRRGELQQALVDALYRSDKLQLAYDDSLTRTPQQAFAERRGNCLSLVLLTAAFAKALELPVDYQQVQVPEALGRSGDLLLRSGHVNIVLGPPLMLDPWVFGDRYTITVDFVPQTGLRGQKAQSLGERTVLALYLNNRAAEALLDQRVDQAYWWARAAVLQDPTLAPALNTLGVVYQRAGQPALAAQALAQVLVRQPDHLSALANQIPVLRGLGRTAEAEVLAARLARLEPEPPFAALDRGRQALQRGDAAAALSEFRRAVQRHGESAELQFWLAQAHLRLGQAEAARQALAQAVALSSRGEERERYGAKLAWLKAQGATTVP